MVQQAILQVLDPICEAKFFDRSNGFRPNRSAENAIAQCMKLIQMQHMYFVVDVDIKGFFDNVNHTKLIRQIWTLGIRDKKLICVIKAMLKAPIVMPDGTTVYPEKGTPQGGILSPLLANIVLNELDWWVYSQWEGMPTKHYYPGYKHENGSESRAHVYRALRSTKLKEMYIVRYADDFKIFCRTRGDANKIFRAVEQWLKTRLKLDISPDKSKIVNLKQVCALNSFSANPYPSASPWLKGYDLDSRVRNKLFVNFFRISGGKVKLSVILHNGTKRSSRRCISING